MGERLRERERDPRWLRLRQAPEEESTRLDSTHGPTSPTDQLCGFRKVISLLVIGSLIYKTLFRLLVYACVYVCVCWILNPGCLGSFLWVAWESEFLKCGGRLLLLCSGIIATISVNIVVSLGFCVRMGKRWILNLHRFQFNSWSYHFQVVWPWANHTIPFLFSRNNVDNNIYT